MKDFYNKRGKCPGCPGNHNNDDVYPNQYFDYKNLYKYKNENKLFKLI